MFTSCLLMFIVILFSLLLNQPRIADNASLLKYLSDLHSPHYPSPRLSAVISRLLRSWPSQRGDITGTCQRLHGSFGILPKGTTCHDYLLGCSTSVDVPHSDHQGWWWCFCRCNAKLGPVIGWTDDMVMGQNQSKAVKYHVFWGWTSKISVIFICTPGDQSQVERTHAHMSSSMHGISFLASWGWFLSYRHTFWDGTWNTRAYDFTYSIYSIFYYM